MSVPFRKGAGDMNKPKPSKRTPAPSHKKHNRLPRSNFWSSDR
jgi:hypothetical protein